MLAGSAAIDITPRSPVWMDGMLRSRQSQGVHDRLSARALAFCERAEAAAAFALVSVDVCALDEETTLSARRKAEARTGIPAANVVIAATHTHAGPATLGIFTPREAVYTEALTDALAQVVERAWASRRPARARAAAGTETTISHYRRLLADDGHVVMNWEPWPPQRILRVLGEADHEVGVLELTSEGHDASLIALLFNHACHPNVLSGDNLLLSAEYPGLAARLLEEELGGSALFFNAALGSVDVDGLRHRDWDGCERAARALADSVLDAVLPAPGPGRVRGAVERYALAGREVTAAERAWSEEVLARTGGIVAPQADGVGDDYRALLLHRMAERGREDLPVEQTCIAVDDCALLSFPGELYTEIGRAIKERSPFARTLIIGLANGYAGYIPTARAVTEGGYAEDTRRVDAAAEAQVMEHSLGLLARVHAAVHGQA